MPNLLPGDTVAPFPLDEHQHRQLTGGGECYLHHHLEDRSPHRDQASRLRELEREAQVSGTTALSYDYDVYVCDTTGGNFTVTLPVAKQHQVLIVVKKVAANVLTIAASGSDTINGAASIALTGAWSAKYIKATAGGWFTL